MKNTLFYGDNLEILREYVPDESVDLVYLDPPFNSNKNYNVLFRDESGEHAEAQIEAFEDTWHWSEHAEATYRDLVTESADEVAKAVSALRDLVGTNQVMAYLVMMAARLVELHRVLKDTGSIYLHCDPTASHYLKVVMDSIFGPTRFRNEIVWQRTSAHKGGALGRVLPLARVGPRLPEDADTHHRAAAVRGRGGHAAPARHVPGGAPRARGRGRGRAAGVRFLKRGSA